MLGTRPKWLELVARGFVRAFTCQDATRRNGLQVHQRNDMTCLGVLARLLPDTHSTTRCVSFEASRRRDTRSRLRATHWRTFQRFRCCAARARSAFRPQAHCDAVRGGLMPHMKRFPPVTLSGPMATNECTSVCNRDSLHRQIAVPLCEMFSASGQVPSGFGRSAADGTVNACIPQPHAE
jgi:hypothetical protein